MNMVSLIGFDILPDGNLTNRIGIFTIAGAVFLIVFLLPNIIVNIKLVKL